MNTVLLGGGHGATVVARALSKGPDVAAVVATHDNGGSSGLLLKQYGCIPPGDITRVVALGFNTIRNGWDERNAQGHSKRNLAWLQLWLESGCPQRATDKFGKLVGINGHRVLPASLSPCTLHAGGVVGEHELEEAGKAGRHFRDVEVIPGVPNPEASRVIREAKHIILAPGSFLGSLAGLLKLTYIAQAVRESKGRIIFISNLTMSRDGTQGMGIGDMTKKVEESLERRIDAVLANVHFPQNLPWLRLTGAESFHWSVHAAMLASSENPGEHDPELLGPMLRAIMH